MRAFTSFFTLAAALPFLLVQAVQADEGAGIVLIRNWADHGDRVDITADGINGKVQAMKFQLVGDNQFKLVEAQGKKVENAAVGNGKFWAGLGNGKDANCRIERKPDADISKKVVFEFDVYNDKYISSCDWVDWVKIVCDVKNFTPDCTGWTPIVDTDLPTVHMRSRRRGGSLSR